MRYRDSIDSIQRSGLGTINYQRSEYRIIIELPHGIGILIRDTVEPRERRRRRGGSPGAWAHGGVVRTPGLSLWGVHHEWGELALFDTVRQAYENLIDCCISNSQSHRNGWICILSAAFQFCCHFTMKYSSELLHTPKICKPSRRSKYFLLLHCRQPLSGV